MAEVEQAKHDVEESRDTMKTSMQNVTQNVSDEFAMSHDIIRKVCADAAV